MAGSSVIAEISTGVYTALQVYCSFATEWFCSNTERRGFITVTHGAYLGVHAIHMKMSFKERYAKQ